ncbi:MAG: hypothetical protein V8S21_01235 [Lachnospira eligens]
MPDDFNKNTSIEDEIEKSLQKMVEEETTVAKAYVGKLMIIKQSSHQILMMERRELFLR